MPTVRTSRVTGTLLAAGVVVLAGCSGDGDGDGDDRDAAADVVVCEEGTLGDKAGPTDSAVRITAYDAVYRIARKGGGLRAEETITAEFDDAAHHGIFRDFDQDELTITDATGSVDGEPQAQVGPGPHGTRITLGNPDVTLDPGEHVFEIGFEANAVLAPATDVDQDWQFDAEVIDPGWTLDIEDVEVRIELPADTSGDVSCVVGPGASASIEGAGTATLVVTADEVPAGSGVRVVAGTDVDPYE